jgi:hypothetical protein
MGILSTIFGIGSGGILPAVTAVANVVDQFVETPEEKKAAEAIKQRMLMAPNLAQIELNKIEAGHRSVFVAGWRPFIGWVSGVGLAYNFVVYPVLLWLSVNFFPDVVPPPLETEALMTLVVSLLGLGGLRTVEKVTGRAQ